MIAVPLFATAGCASGLGEDAAFPHPGRVYNLAFVPHTDYFVSTQLEKGTTQLWDIHSTTPVMKIVDDGISVDATEDGKLVAIGTLRGKVLLWDPKTRKSIRDWSIEAGSAICVAFSPDGSLLAVGQGPTWSNDLKFESLSSYSISIYDCNSGKARHGIKDIGEYAVSIKMDHDNKRLLYSAANHTLRLWSLTNQNYVWRIGERTHHHGATIKFHNHRLCLSPDEKTFFWNGGIYDLETTKLVIGFRDKYIHNLALGRYLPGSDWIVTGANNGYLSIWDVKSGENVRNIVTSKNGAHITALAVSSDGKFVLTGTEGSIGGFDALKDGKAVSDPYVRLWRIEK